MSTVNQILFFGLGSIGQRHLRIAKKLLPKAENYPYRQSKRDLIISDDLTVRPGELANTYGIRELNNQRQALALDPDLVFITNPSSMHLDLALHWMKRGVHMLIEKPLGDDVRKAKKLLGLAKRRESVVYVGYQMQFHPLFIKARKLIREGKLGKLCSGYISVGEYIPTQHGYENYADTYLAKKSLGGGVALSQSHEIYALILLFGTPKQVFAAGGKKSRLNIDVEDTVDALCTYKDFSIQLHMDYLQYQKERFYKFIGDKGTLKLDLIENSLIFIPTSGQIQKTSLPALERTKLFTTEQQTMLNSIRQRDFRNQNLKTAYEVLRIVDAIKKSINSQRIIKL